MHLKQPVSGSCRLAMCNLCTQANRRAHNHHTHTHTHSSLTHTHHTHTHTQTHTHTPHHTTTPNHTPCGITMGQLAERGGVPVEVWLPHHKMAAICTTSPRMQQDPTRCRCFRHLIEGAFKTGGAGWVRASHESRESQEGA